MAAALPSHAPALSLPEIPAPPAMAAGRGRGSGFLKTFAALTATIGTIAAVVWLLESGAAFKSAERALETRLATEAGARAAAVNLVLREVRAAAEPLIGSDLLRVVAGRLAAEPEDGPSQRATWLRSQVPFVRSDLADFQRAHGLEGVAVLSVHGRSLLRVGRAVPPPVSDAWRRGPAFGSVREAAEGDGSAGGPRVDVYLALPPARPAPGANAEPAGILALTWPVAGLLGDVLAPDAGAGIKVWLAQPGTEREQRVVIGDQPALVTAVPGPARDPLWPLVGDRSQPIAASAAVSRAPFRVVAAVPAGVLFAEARDRAGITLPLALLLTLGPAWLLARWHHRRAPSSNRRVDRPGPAPVLPAADRPTVEDEPRGLEPFEPLITAIAAPVALVDDQGCVAAASPAFTAVAAGPEGAGHPLAARLADPAGGAWRELLEEVRATGEVSAGGCGRDRREIRFVARRIEGPAGGTLVTLRPGPEGGTEAQPPRVQAEAIAAALVRAVELRDPFLLGHTERLRQLSGDVARRLGLPDEDCQTLDLAAALSQIGKIFVPDAILTKHGRHDAAEAKLMQAHIEHAARILEPLEFGLPVAATLLQMHERLDGSGYPHGLRGEAIGLVARILGVVDVYCARTATRAYRDRVSPGQALYHLAHHAERYDPQVVAVLATLAAETERSAIRTLRCPSETAAEGHAAA